MGTKDKAFFYQVLSLHRVLEELTMYTCIYQHTNEYHAKLLTSDLCLG